MLLIVGMLSAVSGCSSAIVDESSEPTNENTKTEMISNKTADKKNDDHTNSEEDNIHNVRHYIFLSDKEQHKKLKKAAKETNYDFGFLKDENGNTKTFYTTMNVYPKDNFREIKMNKFIEKDGKLAVADSYGAFTFTAEELPGDYFEITNDELKYLYKIITKETGLGLNETSVDKYDPTTENFATHKGSLQQYGGAKEEFISIMNDRGTYLDDLVKLYGSDYKNPITKEQDIQSDIKLAEQVFEAEEDLIYQEIKIDADTNKYAKYYAIDHLSSLNTNIFSLENKINEVEDMKDVIAPMLEFYEELSLYNNEKVSGSLIDKEALDNYEGQYDETIYTLKEQLSNLQKDKEAVLDSKTSFLVL